MMGLTKGETWTGVEITVHVEFQAHLTVLSAEPRTVIGLARAGQSRA